MTELLKEAISKILGFPQADQDAAAELLLSVVARSSGVVQLDDETREAVQEGLAQARRDDFSSPEEMTELFERLGV
jgi:hypothetical protein